MTTNFRLRGDHFLITWSQVDLEHVSVFEHLDAFAPIKGAVLARELHSDGQPHFHAFIQFERRLDRQLGNEWDLGGRHPNVSPKRYRTDRRAAAGYLRKGSDWIDFGSLSEESEEVNDIDLLSLISTCGDWGEVLNLCYRESIPYALAKAGWTWLHATRPTTIDDSFAPLGTISSRDLLDLDYASIDEEGKPKSFLLCGEPGCGKSTWAFTNAPRPSLVVKHLEDLLFLRVDFHKCIIFDDVEFRHLPRTTQLNLVDMEQSVTIHLRHIVTRIPLGMPRIFCYNLYHEPVDLTDPAILRRCVVINI